jgi:autotransporter translocation and assembly factor TamB
LRWPLAADSEPAFRSPRGSLRLQGTKPWQLEAQGDVLAEPLPVFQAQMRGVLAGDSLQIDRADLALLRGTANLSGEVRWSPLETWKVSGTVHDLDPSTLRHDLPGRVSLGFIASGAPFGDRAALDLSSPT